MKKLYLIISVSVLLNILLSYYYIYLPYTESNFPKNNGNQINHFCEKDKLYLNLNIYEDDIVFLGDSFFDNYNVNEVFDNPKIKNRGIQGATSYGVLDLLKRGLIKSKVEKVFIYVGINDVIQNIPLDVTSTNYQKIIEELKSTLNTNNVYFISVLPVLNDNKFSVSNTKINALNSILLTICQEENIHYLDLVSSFSNNNQLNKKFSIYDGLHLNEVGYDKLTSLLRAQVSSPN